MRDQKLDCWKGLLIFLVVLGHAVGMVSHYAVGTEKTTYELIYKAIYLFHMPAFFFVAGMLYKPGAIMKWVKRLIVPYFIWGVVSIIAFLLLGSFVSSGGNDGYYGTQMGVANWWRPFASLIHAGGWPGGEGFRYNSVLWFLPCMFMCLVTALFVKPNWWTILGCFVLGWIMRKYVPYSLPWGLSMVPRYLGFLLFGSMMKEKMNPIGPIWNLGWFPFIVMVVLLPNMYLAHIKLWMYVIELILACAGIALSYSLVSFISGRCAKIWAIFGVNSLGIMLSHKFMVMGIILIVKSPLVALVLATSLATILSLGLSILLRKHLPFMIGEKYVLR